MYTTENTIISTWFERDRSHIALEDANSEKIILEFWDDELKELVTDGFLNPKDWHNSMVKYANYRLPTVRGA